MTTGSTPELKANVEYYEKRYRAGYGLMYPDGHVIRFHRHILEYELGISEGKVLDYGCGTGAHLAYFEAHGFTPYGCDINERAMEQCKKLLPAYSDNFHVVPSLPRLSDYYVGGFDLILCNQVLYFMNDQGISDLITQFYELAGKGAVFFATMMAPTNYFARYVEATSNGLSKVVLKGRIAQTAYINFKTRDQLLELFRPFRKLHMGFYSHTLREDEGPTDHYIYVGRK